MNKAKRKNILIDLSDLKHPNCGFGQIAINYSKRFANLPIEGLHFFYLLPNCYPKIHSKNVTSVLVRNRKIRKWFPTMCTITHGEKYVIIITIFEGYGMIQIKKSVTAKDGKT